MSENELPARDDQGKTVSRRRFLYLTGAGGLVLAVARSGGTAPGDATAGYALTATATRTLHLRRREDSLNLRIDLFNADVSGAQLRKVGSGGAYLVVHFPPQAVLERTLTNRLGLGDLPLPTRVSGPSRLAFDITSALPMALTVDALLAWTAFVPRLAPTATTTQTASALVAPIDTETALELPWRMLLSPDETEGWKHATTPVTRNDWTELWHTRLGARNGAVVDDDPRAREMRAIWLADPQMAAWVRSPSSVPSSEDITHVLTPKQRFSIVRLSADPALRNGVDPSLPKPVEVSGLTLSSLGASFEAEGRWNYRPTADLQLVGWRHRATLGRDHEVRTEDAGYLWPYGHRASLIQVAERRVARRPNPDGSPGPWYAYLRQTQYVVVQQPTVTYWNDEALEKDGRELPFAAIRVLTRRTPELAAFKDFADPAKPTGTYASFVPKAATAPTTPFLFHLRGIDHEGGEVDFTAPVVFVPGSTTTSTSLLNGIRNAHNTGTSPDAVALRTIDTAGRKIALAHRGTHPAGSTTATVDRIVLHSRVLSSATGRAPFQPRMERAVLRLPEVSAVTGAALPATAFEFAQPYLDSGMGSGANAGGVFLALHSSAPPTPLAVSPATTGGLATPAGDIQSISAKYGPGTAWPIDVAKDQYDPALLFGDGGKAKFLGGLPLKDLLPSPEGSLANSDLVPKMGHRRVPELGVDEWSMYWMPKVKAAPGFEPGQSTPHPLILSSVYSTPYRDGAESGVRLNAELRDFTLYLLGKPNHWVSLEFDYLRYASASGAKTQVDCHVRRVNFQKSLQWVQDIAEKFSFLGGKLEITASTASVKAGLRFQLPEISLGPMAITELAFRAAVELPFDGTPVRLSFGLNSRERPFQLRVFGFNGGGHVDVVLGADGMERLEIGFVFGAGMSLDVGIGSGVVEVAGGITYLLEKVKVTENGAEVVRQQVGLAAFLRIRGALKIFGICTVSVEFYMGLTYLQKTDGSSVLFGEAYVTVSIECFFISETHTFRTQREFAKSPPPAAKRSAAGQRRALAAAPAIPAHPFGAAFTQQDWAGYCAAFAPVGA
ncbi:hypothetical protein SAMN05216553_101599 [Lentzea fradiae]|uniref:Uncharacterized protein n=1 Tax=Lentzea fradiae TaxID=200378 RepID=A0A1G7L1I1_9PSEU|nr:hypothetical protein [Lentzea fradiae]SDF42950.1 hypothetical protein SAMN05216553_101599 [Lentzea fradiae]